jgi:hypothetical protein
MCKDLQIIKLKLKENIEKYNQDLFDLDNEIKRIKIKVRQYQKIIYNQLLKSIEFKQASKNISNENKFKFLLKIKNKNLFRLHQNNKKLIPINF